MAASSRLISVLLSVTGFVLAGCRDDAIAVYRVPKDSGANPALASAPGKFGAAEPADTQPALRWTVPAGWSPRAASPARRGSYEIAGPEGVGDVSVAAMRGDAGGELANVNRWRGQLGLPPIADARGVLQTLGTNSVRMRLFEGANGGMRILCAIVPQPGATWFFKLSGPDALVAREKGAFLGFLDTVQAGSSAP